MSKYVEVWPDGFVDQCKPNKCCVLLWISVVKVFPVLNDHVFFRCSFVKGIALH